MPILDSLFGSYPGVFPQSCTSRIWNHCGSTPLSTPVVMQSVSIAKSKQRRKVSSASAQNDPLYGTYPPTGPLLRFNDVIWGSANQTPQPSIAWMDTRPFSKLQELYSSDDIASLPYATLYHGYRNLPLDVLATECFSSPGCAICPSHGISQTVMPLDPMDWRNPGIQCTAESPIYHQQTLDHNTSTCTTPSMEDDVSLDFDLDLDLYPNSDVQMTPTDTTGFAQDPPMTAVDCTEQLHHKNSNTQEYYPDNCDAADVGNNDCTALDFVGCNQYEFSVDGYPISQDVQEPPPFSGRLDHREVSPITDTGLWMCDFPECRKSFEQRHKYNKHRQSHCRILRCPFPDCGRRAYQEKDIRAHIDSVHNKAKFPCPLEGCPYSRTGPKRGISRKDALMRHLRCHATRRSKLQDTVTT